MKKGNKIILIIVTSIVLLGIIFGIVDYNRAKQNKAPLFAIRVNTYYDGGSKEYYGLGYKVIKYNVLDDPQMGQIGRKDTVFGFWTLEYRKNK